MFSKKSPDPIPGDYQFRALHYGPLSQRSWHRQKLILLERFLQNRHFPRIADAGCGSGIVAHHVASLCSDARVTGLDLSPECVQFAGASYHDHANLRFYEYDLLHPAAGFTETFDFVYSTEVIEHFPPADLDRYLMALKQLGHARTRYLLTTPDYESFWPILEKTLDFFALVPALTGHQHLSSLTKDKLQTILTGAGFQIVQMHNFCGWSSFLAPLSSSLSDFFQAREWSGHKGFLIWCEFIPGGNQSGHEHPR